MTEKTGIIYTVSCLECGLEFQTIHSHGKFCKRDHKQLWHNRKHRAKRKAAGGVPGKPGRPKKENKAEERKTDYSNQHKILDSLNYAWSSIKTKRIDTFI